jgi:NitT/TauT family transport system substrate-binding protein
MRGICSAKTTCHTRAAIANFAEIGLAADRTGIVNRNRTPARSILGRVGALQARRGRRGSEASMDCRQAGRWVFAAVLPVVTVALSACGSGGGTSGPASTATPDKQNPVAIKVGDVEGSPASFIAFATRKGFFTEHGLNVTLVQQQGGAAIVPGLVSGDLQIGGSNIVSMLLARSRGLKVQIIAPGTSVGADPDKDFSAVVVAADSRINTPHDLAGKTFAVNTLKNVNEVVIKSYLHSQGVDVSGVKFTELAFPDMLAAVTQHRVDAALMIEPFVTVALNQHAARVVFRPYVGNRANLQIGTYSASESYIQRNPAIIKAFRAAVAQTATYIRDHPDDYRAMLPSIAKIDPSLAPKVNIPLWRPEIDIDSLRFFAEGMVTYGLVDKQPDVESAVYNPPGS